MFIENIINFFDFYHQRRIINYLKKLKINYFVDVGSHKGEFLSFLLKLRYKKIYCFEPQKKIFKILFKKYRNKKNVEFYNIALSDKNTYKIFYENRLTSTSTFSKSKNTLYSRIKKIILNTEKYYNKKYSIKTTKLDKIFMKKKINNIFLKIDVEGFELNVLNGAKKLVLKKVKFILIERHFFQLYKDSNPKKVDAFLKKNNFKLLKKFNFPLLHFQDNLYIKK